jgi:peptidyl-prolyl cis-trans isomerase SurA
MIMQTLHVLFLLMVILGTFLTNPLFAQTVDKIIAVVDNEIITQTDVDRVLATVEAAKGASGQDLSQLEQDLKKIRENVINQMIEEKLILSEAKKLDIKVDETKIDARIEKIKQSFSSAEEFEMALATQGLTIKDLRDRFHDQEIMRVAVDYFVRSKIDIDPQEIKQFYQSRKNMLMHPEKARVRSILIKIDRKQNEYQALQKAKEVLERLNMGEQFIELARDYSQGANAAAGGALGIIEKGQLIKEIDQAIFSLQPGEFTDVIKTQSGYRIFKLEEKIAPSPLTFSEAQEKIRRILYKQRFAELFANWIEQLKQNADITIK